MKANARRGSRNPNAVLTGQLVREAVRLHASGFGYGFVATWLGVTKACVQRVLTGRSWSHVTGIAPPRATRGSSTP